MYSDEQQEAIRRALLLLEHAGLQPADVLSQDVPSSPLPASISFDLNYVSPSVRYFTSEEIDSGNAQINRKMWVHGIVDHPSSAILEFPETGGREDVGIAHRFKINPDDFVNPKDNIQYSLGGDHSGHNNVPCRLLLDQNTGKPALCNQLKFTCCSIKKCSFNTRCSFKQQAHTPDAAEEVFMKTLGFYCAIRQAGCSLPHLYEEPKSNTSSEDENNTSLDNPLDFVALLQDSRSRREDVNCTGTILMEKDKFGQFFIRCEYFTKGRRNHLRIRNLNEFDLDYLWALFKNNIADIVKYERRAGVQGYGPLVPCETVAVSNGQKQFCPMWHRNAEGILQRGHMQSMGKCLCRFEIYKPNSLVDCPYILIVSRGPHSHPFPTRSKTPAAIRAMFNSLLLPLDWRLADATPRRLALDNAFMHNLRKQLNWNNFRDPTLADLHPSLANNDHTARLINEIRQEQYPKGTGIEGARDLLGKQSAVTPADDQYLRCVETYHSEKEGTFNIAVCMFKAMSELLVSAKHLSIDTSFKRLHNWQEFEMEAWFSEYSRSIVVARAFTTSQSAFAHYMLFKQIFSIVETDTGKYTRFRHIHGDGIDTFTADGHRGQARGLGMYFQEIAKEMNGYCSVEWDKPLYALTPSDHLARCYRYCFAHFNRNVSNLSGHVDAKILAAMMSLYSAQPLPNLQETLSLIRSGGKKAIEWIKDKEASDNFAFAAIYQPMSKIPLEIWRAAPPTSNGNEQAHRNINRDGTKLTMLAGIMRGLQFDSRTLASLDIWKDEGIQLRDCLSTYYYRSARAIRNKKTNQKKIVSIKDKEMKTLYDKAKDLEGQVLTSAMVVKRTLESSGNAESSIKKLRMYDERLKETHMQLKKLTPQCSGVVSLTDLPPPDLLFDRQLLEIRPRTEPTRRAQTSKPLTSMQTEARPGVAYPTTFPLTTFPSPYSNTNSYASYYSPFIYSQPHYPPPPPFYPHYAPTGPHPAYFTPGDPYFQSAEYSYYQNSQVPGNY